MEAIGSRKLIRTFRHHLVRDKLPEDIAPLIFSPLYLKLYKEQIQNITRARSMKAYPYGSDSDGRCEWETSRDVSPENNDYSDDGDAVKTASASLHTIPSIENDDGVIVDDLPQLHVSEGEAIEPSTWTEAQEPVIRKLQAETNSQAQTGKKHNTAGTDNKWRIEHQPPTSSGSQSPAEKSCCQPVLGQIEGHIRGKENSSFLDRKVGGLPIDQAPCVRLFSDLMLSTTIMTPAPEEDCVHQVEALLRNIDECGADRSTNLDSGCKDTRRRKKKRKQREGAKREHGGNTATNEDTSKGADASRITKAPSPPRGRTPKLLADENRRQACKLAKPLVAKNVPSRPAPVRKATPANKVRRRVVHKEIKPPTFYQRLRSGTPRGVIKQQDKPFKDILGTEGSGGRVETRSGSSQGTRQCHIEPTLPGLDLLRNLLRNSNRQGGN
ncbi:hypothetical protein RRF57_011234 [Xylaria bambusicola]|uniref:Uncharacterized protein n=1 Tax=Xylaria bambusicola TaxID=326684 RepID=A0AAN7Z9K7_9PEZI